MTITRKEIKTEIHVEITREEFCDNYQAMMDDLYNKRIIDTRVLVEKIVKFHELDAEHRNQMAQDSFTSLFGEIHCATIRYIAKAMVMMWTIMVMMWTIMVMLILTLV